MADALVQFDQPISACTRYAAVFGHPVGHSASPAFQNAGMAAMGLNWRYLAFDVLPERLTAALEGARQMRFIGVNLTVPHKMLAVEWMDVLDESARAWGAVNTVRFEGRESSGAWVPLGQWEGPWPQEVRAHGFNTDADAVVTSLREDLQWEPAGRRVCVLGAGGAGRVAVLRLAAAGVAALHVVNRTREKAAALAEEVRRCYPGVSAHPGYPKGAVDLVVNATSLGLKAGDPLPFDSDQFDLKEASAAYDMIYEPVRTGFLERAERAGCRTSNGLGMLLHQGVKALEIWSGRPAPAAVMRQALTEHIYGH